MHDIRHSVYTHVHVCVDIVHQSRDERQGICTENEPVTAPSAIPAAVASSMSSVTPGVLATSRNDQLQKQTPNIGDSTT